MRIVGGELGGRVLKAPKGTDTRPTSDRVREATFSRLEALVGSPLPGTVLDAYAGTGALGLEALSRGATSATFIERDRAGLRVLRDNVASLGLAEAAHVLSGDTRSLIARGDLPGAPFALLFLDPPYRIDESEVSALVEKLAEQEALMDGAYVVWEHAAEARPAAGPHLEDLGRKTYGTTHVSWYRVIRGGEADA
jgi:16S rRNA (guanine966-N2)-methyltransferase